MSQKDPNSPELLTRKEVKAVLRCSMSTIAQMEEDGMLSVARYGRRCIRYSKPEVEALATPKRRVKQ